MQDHAGAAFGSQWGVAAELNGVAVALFGVDEQGAAVEGFASPLRLAEGPRGVAHLRGLPAPLVFGPAGGEAAASQQSHGQMVMSVGVIRAQGDGSAKTGFGFFQAALLLQRDAAVAVSFRESGTQGDRGVEAGDGFGNAALQRADGSEGAVVLRGDWAASDGAGYYRGGFVQAAGLLGDHAGEVKCVGVGGFGGDHAAV